MIVKENNFETAQYKRRSWVHQLGEAEASILAVSGTSNRIRGWFDKFGLRLYK